MIFRVGLLKLDILFLKWKCCKIRMASLRVVRLTFNSSDNSFSLGNLSPAEKRFSIVIIDNNVSAILCESILFFMGYITSAFFDIILCVAVNFKQKRKYYVSIYE